jgi:SAM-dependent methyltransferase
MIELFADLRCRAVSADPIRQVERASIRAFMEKHAACLTGRVLDFGAGQQPYRDLVSGDYIPYEKGGHLTGGYVDAVMCNQVLQYVDRPLDILRHGIYSALKPGGHLLLTYPTNWDEVEPTDLWRWTRAGMEQLLRQAGFAILIHERRAEVVLGNFKFPLGYGAVCTRP